MNKTYIKAKSLAKQGLWNSAWTAARGDHGLLPTVDELTWKQSVQKTLMSEAAMATSSKFHHKLISNLYELIKPISYKGSEGLLGKMLKLADQDKTFKSSFDSAMIAYSTTSFREVAEQFGDYWRDLEFQNQVDTIDAAFGKLN